MRSRAEALYELSQFERSLIFFHRCARARPDLAVEFRKGLKKTKNAIGEGEATKCCTGRLKFRFAVAVNALAPDCFSQCPDLDAVRERETVEKNAQDRDFPKTTHRFLR